MKRTKIVCTIGPSSESQFILERMMRAGMNVCRLNMSHGDYVWHGRAIKNIRTVAKKLNVPTAILLDLQGPKVRLGELKMQNAECRIGDEVVFTTRRKGLSLRGKDSPLIAKIPIALKDFHKFVKKGSHLLIADGTIECVVEKVKGKDIHARITLPGKLISHKGIAVQGVSLPLPCLTAKDKKDARWACQQDIDFVALSFVKKAEDVKVLRKLLGSTTPSVTGTLGVDNDSMGGSVQIIVKIETSEAVKNFNSILLEADGIMIARGDLALAVGAEEVPIIQKTLIEKCRAAAKPVIVATEMLGSMEKNPRPTRAEASDVANAVIDHTDAVMLSGESATGNFPVETVQTMAKIIKRMERSHFDDLALTLPATSLSRGERDRVRGQQQAEEETVFGASILARDDKAKAMVSASLTGRTGRLLSRYRTELPIYVGSPDLQVVRQLNLSWGLVPFYLPRVKNSAVLSQKLLDHLKIVARVKGNVVLISSDDLANGEQNMVELKKI